MDDIIPQDTSLKQCSKCKQFFPATAEHFSPKRKNSPEFRAACKVCIRKPNDANSSTRVCPSCKQEKPNTDTFFFFDRKQCKECISVKGKQYIETHKEQHQTFMQIYYLNHKEEYRKRDKAFNQRHPNNRKAYTRKYQLKHREKELARSREIHRIHPERQQRYSFTYRQRHPERIKESSRRWRIKYRDRANVYKRNYYARKKRAQGTHTIQDIWLQYQRQKGRCYYCKHKVGKEKHEYHVDHVVPLSRGGSNGPDNLVIACPTCNTSKNDKLPHEWSKGGRLL